MLVISPASGAATDTSSFDAASAALDIACPIPDARPYLPSGWEASAEEMDSGKQSLASFESEMIAYTDCLATAESRVSIDEKFAPSTLKTVKDVRANEVAARREAASAAYRGEADSFSQRGLTVPRLKKAPPSDMGDRCFTALSEPTWVVPSISISERGAITHVELPKFLPTEIAESVRCMINQMQFLPARRDGKAVPSTATMPMGMSTPGGEPAPKPWPHPESTRAELLAAQQSCMPAGMTGSGRVGLTVSISSWGRVSDAHLSTSSGSRLLDQVATCIALYLRFGPPASAKSRIEHSLQLTVDPASVPVVEP